MSEMISLEGYIRENTWMDEIHEDQWLGELGERGAIPLQMYFYMTFA
jgi:hypothetical protein